MKKIEVVAAIICCQDEILCVQRAKSKYAYVSEKYEFPGGKIEADESPKEALKREVNEELSLCLSVGDFFLTIVHQYPDFEITMHSYLCEVTSKSGIILNEHIDQKWLKREELAVLDWAAADIPIVDKLRAHE